MRPTCPKGTPTPQPQLHEVAKPILNPRNADPNGGQLSESTHSQLGGEPKHGEAKRALEGYSL